jgi:transposase
MDCVGVDYHKRYMVATGIDGRDTVPERRRVENTPEAVVAYFRALTRGAKVALEATGGWYHFYELVEALGLDVVLAHPLKTRAIAESRIKTNKVSSAILAHLLRPDLLPSSYIPSRQRRDAHAACDRSVA